MKGSSRELKFTENTAKTASLFKMVAKQAMKENLQCTSKYGHLRISQDICHVGTTNGFGSKNEIFLYSVI